MEGQGVVAISLPVRIFEKRSAIERICDLWATGPIYLNKAAKANSSFEKMKHVITFVISSAYGVVDMRKPFNPIIGETFEGYWPDGTWIYLEHISHHPPISSFLVENVGVYWLYGSLEYKGKMGDFGNSVSGGIVGNTYIEFADGSMFVYDLAPITIAGLIYGKWLVHFTGGINFVEWKSGYKCELKLNKEARVF